MRIELPRLTKATLQEAQASAPIASRRFSSSDTTVLPGEFQLPALEVGQELSALVAGELADGRIVLDLGDALIEANNPGNLGAGQTLRLRVDHIEPEITLHIIEQGPAAEEEAAKFLRQHLPAPPAEQESLVGLKTKIEAVHLFGAADSSLMRFDKLKSFLAGVVDTKEPFSAERLMQLVRDGGLHYENKLFRAAGENPRHLVEIADNDLKGLLLGALKELETNAVAGAPRHAIENQLDDIESRQAVNLLAQLEGHAVQLQVPFSTLFGFANVALSVERDGQGTGDDVGKSSQGYNILLLLDLENFGRTRIDAHLKVRDLTVTFYVEREDSIARLRRELPAFRELLLSLGYRQALLAAQPLRAMPQARRPKFEALALGVPPNLQLLNLTV